MFCRAYNRADFDHAPADPPGGGGGSGGGDGGDDGRSTGLVPVSFLKLQTSMTCQNNGKRIQTKTCVHTYIYVYKSKYNDILYTILLTYPLLQAATRNTHSRRRMRRGLIKQRLVVPLRSVRVRIRRNNFVYI